MTNTQPSMNDLKEKLTLTADKAKEMATSALDTASDAGRTVTAEVKTHAADTLDAVRDAAGEKAGAVRDTLVDAADRLADRLVTEGDGSTGLSAQVLNGLAGGVATVSDSLRGRTLGDLLADAQGYARRHPGTFAVGAAIAGFALARFIGSSTQREATRYTADTQGQPTVVKAQRG